jgi:enediyne biosynthesis protein E4
VIKELPNVTEITVPVDMHPDQQMYHAGFASGIAKILGKKYITPFDQQRLMLLPDGFRIEPILHDPLIQSPVGITFDGNGRIDPVMSYYIEGRSHPAHPRDILIDQMIGMKGRFPTYTDYANATLDRTLSREERGRAHVLEAVNFESVLLENLGGGRFTMRPLPIRAQVAPIFGMLVSDFNGDGNLDVLLAGNSHATETRIGWYTASNGGVLLGDGNGGFEFLDGVRSGFYVGGDAKALAEVMVGGDRSLFLVTQNRDSVKTFALTRASHNTRVRLEPDDAFALLTFRDGRQQRREFHYGSSYLSQSSRILDLPAEVAKVVIHGRDGRTRTVGK